MDNGDDTVTDNCTGLMWQQDTADIGNDGTITDADDVRLWCDAITYCEELTFGAGNHTDWRLPNVRELHSLVDFSRESPAIDTDFFAATAGGNRAYWSSTSIASSNGDWEWIVFFDTGRLSSVCRPIEQAHGHVRAVRDAQ